MLEIARVTVPPSSQKARVIAWEQLRDLKDGANIEMRVNDARIAEVMRRMRGDNKGFRERGAC